MLRVVEKHAGGVIQKVTKPGGELVRFQVLTAENVVTPCKSLAEAREKLGVVIKHPEKLTTPKADCPHNQPGSGGGGAKKK